ncbi:MAG: hypothetical protein ACJAS3_003564 [Roseivirga sp.]|jgi:hypothetical protein
MLTPFEAKLHEIFTKKQYSKLSFFNQYKEFHTVNALVKSIERSEEGGTISLSTGEIIPIDKVVSLNGQLSDQYKHIEDFICDC